MIHHVHSSYLLIMLALFVTKLTGLARHFTALIYLSSQHHRCSNSVRTVLLSAQCLIQIKASLPANILKSVGLRQFLNEIISTNRNFISRERERDWCIIFSNLVPNPAPAA